MVHLPLYLASRDLLAGAGPRLRPKTLSTGSEELDEQIRLFSEKHCTKHDPLYLQALITLAVQAGQTEMPDHDFELMARTVKEMLESSKSFAPYKDIRKITVFGSARIKLGEAAYETAREFGEKAVEHGYMVITGGGPGIMQAANEGAGCERSFGLNINLPFEQHANPVVQESPRLVNYHYFFVRKLNFVAQSDALVACPGGFGTMDEIFETLTLMQTGKSSIFPIVLLDSPGKTFWLRWSEFVWQELIDAGLISQDDMHLMHITKSPQDAIEHIDQFYRIFHSYRFVDGRISIRLTQELDDDWIKKLEAEFADIITHGHIRLQDAMPEEDDEPQLADLPRLVFRFNRTNYGRLRLLINKVNEYPEGY